MFRTNEPFPGIRHITDSMGVSFTLVEGKEQAILFDTGYGMENVAAYLRKLTDKPITVMLSHGHHDHILGARWFSKTWICAEDLCEFTERTGILQRSKVLKQAEDSGISAPHDYLDTSITAPEPICFREKTGMFRSLKINLGKLEVRIINVPGHTPGSVMMYVPEYELLLTADNWNPCTWMWFPSSIRADLWRKNMNELIRLLETAYCNTVNHVLCSHQPMVKTGEEMKSYLEYMTVQRMREAPPVNMGAQIDTHQIVKGNWTLVFDMEKIIC